MPAYLARAKILHQCHLYRHEYGPSHVYFLRLNKAKIGNLYIGIEPALILNGLKDCIHHIIHGQAKVLEKRLSRRRFSKWIDADNAAFKPDVFAPEIADARFDCNPLDAARQYMLPP